MLSLKAWWGCHHRPLLALLLLSLAAYAAVEAGNHLGADEWLYTYTASERALWYYPDRLYRPLNMLPFTLVHWLAGPGPFGLHAASLMARFAAAGLLYLIVRHITPQVPHFALACGMIYLLYPLDDFFLLQMFSQTSENWGSLLLTLAAIYVMLLYLRHGRWWLLAPAACLGVGALLLREDGLALMAALPLITFAFDPARRSQKWGLLAWLLLISAAAGMYALPLLGLGAGTYGSSQFADLSAARLARASLQQMLYLFSPGTFSPDLNLVLPYRLNVLIVLAAAALGWHLLPKAEHTSLSVIDGIKWAAAGLVITWLGFVIYLPTGLVNLWEVAPARLHTFSVMGCAVAVCGAIWAAAGAAPHLRRVIIPLGLGLVLINGAANIARMQTQFYTWGATWDTASTFMRSLAHQMPDVAPGTLILYITDPQRPDTPFISGYGFQFAVRYVYEDRAEGIPDADNLAGHAWAIEEAGIRLSSDFPAAHPWYRPGLYTWDEIIAITLSPDGQAVMLDQLPEGWGTPARDALYNPRARIEPGYVGPRTLNLFPPVQSGSSR